MERDRTIEIADTLKPFVTIDIQEKFTHGEQLQTFEDKYIEVKNEHKLDPTVVFAIGGPPAGGKDWYTWFVARQFLMQRLHANPKEIKATLWEDMENDLIREGRICPLPGQPFNHGQLTISYRRQKHYQANEILKDGKFNIWQYPGGTELEYGTTKPVWFTARKYGDKMMSDMFRLIDRVYPGKLNEIMYLEVDLIRGPWMDVWGWYRHFILKSASLNQANEINEMFGLHQFGSLDEWYMYKNGGSALIIEEAQKAVHSIVQYATFSVNNIDDSIVNPYEMDMPIIADLIGMHPAKYRTRVKHNLGLGYVYMRNYNSQLRILKDKRPFYMQRFAVVNNPQLIIPDHEALKRAIREEQYRLKVGI